MSANYILKSEAIFDSIGDKPFPGFIAVKGNKIESISSDMNEMSKYVDADTQLLDFHDKLIISGFGESHSHAFYGALESIGANVVDAVSEKEAVEVIYEHEKHRKSGWIIAFGWNNEYWEVKNLPTKASLDKRFPNIPVAVINEELHGMWVNSKALELCGIDRNTEVPKGNGMISKDENGDPDGYILETPAMKLIFRKAFKFSPEEERHLIEHYFKIIASYGITSISNLQIHDILKEEIFAAMDQDDKMCARMSICATVNESLDTILKMRKTYHSDKLKFGGVKGFADGTPMGYTGTLIEEYSDRPGYFGECYMNVATFGDKAVEFEKNDIRMRIHACGDGAVRNTLDIFDYAKAKAPGHHLRHTIEHIEVIHPDDIERFGGDSNIIASVQPEHMWSLKFEEHPFHKILGEKRCRYTYPFKTLLNRGTVLAFGSDHPIASLNPMNGIYRAVTRLAEDRKPEGGWNPNEKLSVSESIKAYTIGSAYQMYNEHITGTLEPGKMADIVVIDKNLFEVDAEEILDAKIIMTMFDGKIIYKP